MPQKQDDNYSFSYPFEYIAKNYGNDNYDIGMATMNVNLVWNDAGQGYDVTIDVPEMSQIDPSQGNGDAKSFYDYGVHTRLMDDLRALEIGPELLVDAGIF